MQTRRTSLFLSIFSIRFSLTTSRSATSSSTGTGSNGQYHSQLLSGGDYSALHPVFEIAFLAQNYQHEQPEQWDANHIVSHYSFIEKRTGECPNPTIFIILAEIGRFNKVKEECITTRDRLFYWFRHANEFKEKPEWLDDPETRALLNATEIAAFTPEKKEIYDQDMKIEQDIEYEKSICYREGIAEGKREHALLTAENLLKKGIDQQTIAECTGLSFEEVLSLDKGQ